MNPLKSVDTPSVLTAAFFLGLACLPVALVYYAGHASRPKEQELTLRDQYPDDHLFV